MVCFLLVTINLVIFGNVRHGDGKTHINDIIVVCQIWTAGDVVWCRFRPIVTYLMHML